MTKWRERRHKLDALLPELLSILSSYLDAHDTPELGHALDLAFNHLTPESPHFENIARLRLNPLADFTCLKTLASNGSISSVDVASPLASLAQNAANVIVKKVNKAFATKMAYSQCSIRHERDILLAATQQKRQGLLHLIAACQTPTDVYLVLPIQTGGDLWSLIESRPGGRIPEKWAVFYTAQTIDALLWLHELGYAHRDIKPNNLLLTPEGHIRLSDFGSAAPLVNGKVDPRYTAQPVGTVDYIAYEILQAQQQMLEESLSESQSRLARHGGLYGPDVDFWSLGVLFFEAVAGVAPFYADSIPDTYEKILNYNDNLHFGTSGLSADGIDFVKRLLREPENRLGQKGSAELKMHRIFRKLEWTKLHQQTAPFIPEPKDFDEYGGGQSQSVSKAFDFSAMFSSPGLSILRSSIASTGPATDEWVGFSYEPSASAFESPFTPSRSFSQRVRFSPPTATPGPGHLFKTPARQMSSTPFTGSNSRKKRNAMNDLIAYGVMKSAQKQRKPSILVPRESEKNEQVGTEIKREGYDGLKQKHQSLVKEVEDLSTRYEMLVKRYVQQ